VTIVTPNFNATPDESRQVADPITELLRAHARTLIQSALEVEVECVLADLRDAGAHVVRNGHLPQRQVTTAIGDVAVSVPRIRSRDGGSVNFASTMVPRYLRRSASIDAWACYAYLSTPSPLMT
jgi:putative transposase